MNGTEWHGKERDGMDRYAYRHGVKKGQITLECRDPCLLENGADVFWGRFFVLRFLFSSCAVCSQPGSTWLYLARLGSSFRAIAGDVNLLVVCVCVLCAPSVAP